MSSRKTDELPGFPLWDFSLRVYACPGVAPAAIALQDEAGLDVNLLLFCQWSARDGPGRLSAVELSRCMAAVADWQQTVVQPLRALRRRLKPAGAETSVLGSRLAAAELAAEHAEQWQLARLVAGSAAPASGDSLVDAAANLDTYLACAGVNALPDERPDLRRHIAVLLEGLTTLV